MSATVRLLVEVIVASTHCTYSSTSGYTCSAYLCKYKGQGQGRDTGGRFAFTHCTSSSAVGFTCAQNVCMYAFMYSCVYVYVVPVPAQHHVASRKEAGNVERQLHVVVQFTLREICDPETEREEISVQKSSA